MATQALQHQSRRASSDGIPSVPQAGEAEAEAVRRMKLFPRGVCLAKVGRMRRKRWHNHYWKGSQGKE